MMMVETRAQETGLCLQMKPLETTLLETFQTKVIWENLKKLFQIFPTT